MISVHFRVTSRALGILMSIVSENMWSFGSLINNASKWLVQVKDNRVYNKNWDGGGGGGVWVRWGVGGWGWGWGGEGGGGNEKSLNNMTQIMFIFRTAFCICLPCQPFSRCKAKPFRCRGQLPWDQLIKYVGGWKLSGSGVVPWSGKRDGLRGVWYYVVYPTGYENGCVVFCLACVFN